MNPEQIKSNLQSIIDVQCRHGNYDYDPYMFGLANGLILAMSCITGERPEYLEPPKRWIVDKMKFEVDLNDLNLSPKQKKELESAHDSINKMVNISISNLLKHGRSGVVIKGLEDKLEVSAVIFDEMVEENNKGEK